MCCPMPAQTALAEVHRTSHRCASHSAGAAVRSMQPSVCPPTVDSLGRGGVRYRHHMPAEAEAVSGSAGPQADSRDLHSAVAAVAFRCTGLAVPGHSCLPVRAHSWHHASSCSCSQPQHREGHRRGRRRGWLSRSAAAAGNLRRSVMDRPRRGPP
jgi:hypothetical protein